MTLPPFRGIQVAGAGHGRHGTLGAQPRAQALVSMRHPVRPTTRLPLHRHHE